MLRFLVIDHHPVSRSAILSHLKEEFCGMNCDMAKTGAEGIDFAAQNKYDCIITEPSLPDGQPAQLIEQIRALQPSTPLLIFTILPGKIFAKKLMQSGGTAYMNKSAPLDDFINLVHLMISYFNDPDKWEEAKAQIGLRILQDSTNPIDSLTEKEHKVMMLLVKGFSIEKIATLCNSRTSSIFSLRKKIFKKCEVDNVLDLKSLSRLFS